MDDTFHEKDVLFAKRMISLSGCDINIQCQMSTLMYTNINTRKQLPIANYLHEIEKYKKLSFFSKNLSIKNSYTTDAPN